MRQTTAEGGSRQAENDGLVNSSKNTKVRDTKLKTYEAKKDVVAPFCDVSKNGADSVEFFPGLVYRQAEQAHFALTRKGKHKKMAAKKFYAIAVGRRPGIYENWPEAQAQVLGFQGAKYKGFPTRAEAEAWLEKPIFRASAPGGRKTSARTAPPVNTGASSGEEGVQIYTDGGSRFNPGPGGYGVVQLYRGERIERSGGFRLTTNNRMELMACIVALSELEYRDQPVALYSDSSYVVNGISRGWARSWQKRGWIKADRQPAVNPDLWAQLLRLVDELQVTFHWVRGHSGHPLNERCDELAVAFSRRTDLPEDPGYRG